MVRLFSLWWMIGFVVALGWPAGQASARDTGLTLHTAGGITGLPFYDQGEWGVVRSVVVNAGASDAQALVLVSLRDVPGVLYGSQVWVPARSEKQVLTYLSTTGLPRGYPNQGPETQVTLVELTGNQEKQRDSKIGVVPYREPGMRSAVSAPRDGGDEARQLHAALLEAAGAGSTAFSASPEAAPADPMGWAGLDTLMLAQARGISIAQVRAIRHWVANGGRLWVMLDQTGSQLPATLLGKDWRVETLGRTALTDFRITGEGIDTRVARDYPIEFVQTLPLGAEVLLKVDGRPAALRWQAGRGEVMVTTLAASGWLDAGGQPIAALSALTDFFPGTIRDKTSTTAQKAERTIRLLEPAISSQVGHRVPQRLTVGIGLWVFLVVVLVVGLVLSRRGLSEWTAPASVGAAVICAGFMIALGWITLSQSPGVLGATMLTHAEPGLPGVEVTGMLAAYRQPGAAQASALIYDGPPPLLDEKRLAGGVRLVRLDRDRWMIGNIDLAPGEAHVYPVAGPIDQGGATGLTGELDERGIRLRWAGGHGPRLADPLFATGDGRIAVVSEEDGSYFAPFDRARTGGRFIDSGMLTQQQMERSAVYEQVLDNQRDRLAARPSLLGWRQDAVVEVDPVPGVELRSESLSVYPVLLRPPTPGQMVRIPSILLDMAPYRDKKLKIAGTIFDASTRSWVQNLSNPQTIAMRFSIPDAFRQVQLKGAQVTLDLECPGRDFEVFTVFRGKLHVVHRGNSAAGLTKIAINDPSKMRPASSGSVIIGLRVGMSSSAQNRKTWSLSQIAVDLIGQAPPK